MPALVANRWATGIETDLILISPKHRVARVVCFSSRKDRTLEKYWMENQKKHKKTSGCNSLYDVSITLSDATVDGRVRFTV